MVRSRKKGQVTLFVIIGAIILLAAALIFFITREVTQEKPGIKEPEVSLEARPAMELISGCLEQTAKEALIIAGKQGGAVTLQPQLAAPSYRGEAVEFSPYVVPFWRHLEDCASPSGCEASSQYPLCRSGDAACITVLSGRDSVQEQLEEYIVEQVKVCVNEFTGLSEVYILELIDEPSATVYFGSGQTSVVLSYPTQITSQSSADVKLVDDYIVNFDVDVLDMYGFAEEIIMFERTHNYYERQTMNLVASYAGLNSELPPIAEIDLSASENIWVRPRVEQVLQYDLLPFMGLVQILNTDDARRMYQRDDLGEYTLFAQGVYETFLPKTSETVYSYDVTHHYLYEPIYFSIVGHDVLIRPGDLLGDSLLVELLSGAIGGIKDYRFGYHITYPLVITLHDEDAFGGEGYDFQFAIEVNIRNNEPAYQNFTHMEISPSMQASLADYHLRPEHEITVVTTDKRTGEPLNDVIISYVCGDEFTLGQTELYQNVASFTSTFPYCELGGFIRYEKNGYLGESFAFDNREDTGNQYFEFALWPLEEKEVKMLRRTPNNITAVSALGSEAIFGYDTLAQELSPNQTVFFNIERLIQTPYDTTVPQVGFVQFKTSPVVTPDFTAQLETIEQAYADGVINQSMYVQMKTSLEEAAGLTVDYAVELPSEHFLNFAPGNYSVEAYLMDEGGMYVPNDTVEITDTDWFEIYKGEWWSGEDTADLPELNISSWPSGGAVFTFELTPGMLYNDRPITFYVLEQIIPQNWTQMQKYVDIEEFQVGKERLIRPLV